jgi:hypothetical protein
MPLNMTTTIGTFNTRGEDGETHVHIKTASDNSPTPSVSRHQPTTRLVRTSRPSYLLFMTHFSADDIPIVWHRLNEADRTNKITRFCGYCPMARVCPDSRVRRLKTRPPNAHS